MEPAPPSGWELFGSNDTAEVWARDPLGHVHSVYWLGDDRFPPRDMLARLIVVGFGVHPATGHAWTAGTLRAAYAASPAYMKVAVEPHLLLRREEQRAEAALGHICHAMMASSEAYDAMHQLQIDRRDPALNPVMTHCERAWRASGEALAAVQGYAGALREFPKTAQDFRVLAAAEEAVRRSAQVGAA